MKRSCLLVPILALLLLPGTVWAEVLNYDYVYLSENGTESDGGDEIEGNTMGGYKSFGGYTHVFASFDDSGVYTAGNPNWKYDLKTLRIGVGGHYMIGKRTMIAPAISILSVDGDVMAPSWTTPRELSDTGYVVELDLRHAVTDWLELTAAARRTTLFEESS